MSVLLYREGNNQLMSWDDRAKYADEFFKCGLFGDVFNSGQALVKIMVGEDIGLSPIESMRGIHIFEAKGRVQIIFHGTVIAGQIKMSGKYNYKIIESTPERCEIEFYENGESIGKQVHDTEKAKAAGYLTPGKSGKIKENWEKHPEDMHFYRAISKGQKKYCPEVFRAPVYTEGEIDVDDTPNLPRSPARIPESGTVSAPDDMFKNAMQPAEVITEKEPEPEVIEQAEVVETKPVAMPTPEPEEIAPPKVASPEPKMIPVDNPARPMQPEALRDHLRKLSTDINNWAIASKSIWTDHIIGIQRFTLGIEENRKMIIKFLFERNSSKELTVGECTVLKNWMGMSEVEPGEWAPDPIAYDEAEMIIKHTSKSEPKPATAAKQANIFDACNAIGGKDG